MCGIAGIFSYEPTLGTVEEAQLRAMHKRMISRGPDGEGVWFSPDRRAGLTHRRLAIVDLSMAGSQPMHDDATGNAIVFNGEIYNHRELRGSLEQQGYRFRSGTDTEVILKLYAACGLQCFSMLRGMYALAIYEHAEQRLLLARDSFGIKPLYIASDGKSLRFASQVKALLAAGVDEAPEPAGHVGFLLWGHVPDPFTLYKGIRAVPAGASIVVKSDGSTEEHRHFDLAEKIVNLRPLEDVRSAGDAASYLAFALQDAVRHHLVSDVPVGAFLSAGIDSGTLVGLTHENGLRKLKTVTLGFDEYRGTQNDEVPLAEAVARQFQTQQVTKRLRRSDFDDCLSHILDVMDQPSIDGVNTYFVSEAAARAGLKVALSGVGADELFAGYPGFHDIPRLARLTAVPARLPGLGKALRRVIAPFTGRWSPKYAGLVEFGGSVQGAYLLRHALFMPWEIEGIIDPEMARKGWENLDALGSLERSLPRVDDARLKVSALVGTCYMRDQLLRDTDWAGMAHSVEVRTPFVDVLLWEAVVRLVLTGFGPSKLQMTSCLRNPLPGPVLARRKTGFLVPVSEWLGGGVGTSEERGLRGWARRVYQSFGFPSPLASSL